jgi:hypothetical protein
LFSQPQSRRLWACLKIVSHKYFAAVSRLAHRRCSTPSISNNNNSHILFSNSNTNPNSRWLLSSTTTPVSNNSSSRNLQPAGSNNRRFVDEKIERLQLFFQKEQKIAFLACFLE